MNMPMFNIITMLFVVLFTVLILVICCCSRIYLRRTHPNHPFLVGADKRLQKNDRLKDKFFKQFTNSLKRFRKRESSTSRCAEALQEDLMSSCPICFEEYTGESKAIFMGYIKACKHFYHFKCIWEWLEKNKDCPLCRNQVKLQEEDITGLSFRNLVELLQEERNPQSQPNTETVIVNENNDSASISHETLSNNSFGDCENTVQTDAKDIGNAPDNCGINHGTTENVTLTPGESSNMESSITNQTENVTLEGVNYCDGNRDGIHDNINVIM